MKLRLAAVAAVCMLFISGCAPGSGTAAPSSSETSASQSLPGTTICQNVRVLQFDEACPALYSDGEAVYALLGGAGLRLPDEAYQCGPAALDSAALAARGNCLMVAPAGGEAVFTTADGGKSWSVFRPGGECGTPFPCIVSEKVLWLALEGNEGSAAVFRSLDGGESWSRCAGGADSAMYESVSSFRAYSGECCLLTRRYHGGEALSPIAFSTADGGKSWTRAEIALPGGVFELWSGEKALRYAEAADSFEAGGRLYLRVELHADGVDGAADTLFYVSADSGGSWSYFGY